MADFATESGHWYAKDGSPAYTMKGKNGENRAVTLRDARKLGLVPSVTTICRLEAKPALERWKIEQACLACLTLPRTTGEDDTTFLKRALEDSKEQARKAAERGTYIHGLIEETIGRGKPPVKASARDELIVNAVTQWLNMHFADYAWAPERSFATDKFGGKIDLYGRKNDEAVVIDFKTKKGLDVTKNNAYEEHCTQLAAYAYGFSNPIASCINLFVDTDEPGVIQAHEWSREDRDNGWECFSHLLQLWYLRKKLC